MAALQLKLMLITWVAVYPVITLILVLLGPSIAAWPLPVRTLLLTGIMVPVMHLIAMPVANSLFGRWLKR